MPKTQMKKKQQKALARRSPSKLARKAPPTIAEAIEKVLITDDLTSLSAEQRVQYYNAVCKSLGLNPLTHPFAYIIYKEWDADENNPGRMVLYALRSCTDQLRKIHGVTVISIRRWEESGMLYAEALVADKFGRTDSSIGAIPTQQWSRKKREFYTLSGRMLANAKMHVETKAKRRATLSICGLAFLDEAELDTMRVVGGVTPEGRIYRYPALPEEASTGSRAAAQAVLQEKLSGAKPLHAEQPEKPSASQPGTELMPRYNSSGDRIR